MSKAGKALYKWNLMIKQACADYGGCLTRIDQERCDRLLEAWRTTQQIIGEPNPNSESQIGHYRRFHHAGKMITQNAHQNGLELPAWSKKRWLENDPH